jgi:hypothetical protein
VASSPPHRVESGISSTRPAACPYSRRIGGAACDASSRGGLHTSPFWQDGAERPIQRPTDPEEQEEYYSGKKKRHTLKNLLVINETCHIDFLSHTCDGKASDQGMAELAGYTLPVGSCLYQDKGFLGFFLPDMTIFQPK